MLLRHFLKHVDDSKTTGPDTYSGIIGKQLEICEHLSIVVFKTIESDLPYVGSGDLSTDQNNLLDIFKVTVAEKPPEYRLGDARYWSAAQEGRWKGLTKTWDEVSFYFTTRHCTL